MSQACTSDFTMVERVAPSRPYRLGTRRRRPRRADDASEAGASRSAKSGPTSLDTAKYLQTTAAEWLQNQLTEKDLYQAQIRLHGRLLNTYHKLWQDFAAEGFEKAAAEWEKKWLRLYNCRMEWVGWRADCCKGSQTPLAVPIGCNDRLCPICAYDRSRIARRRIKSLFDRLTHPVLITLTIPNKESIRKHDYKLFRQRVRALLAQYKGWIEGGVYSLETTYNRRERTWHIHVHILADVNVPLPPKEERVVLAGKKVCRFTELKLRMELAWYRLWSPLWGKKLRRNAQRSNAEHETYIFEEWVKAGRRHSIKVYDAELRRKVNNPRLSRGELARRTEWNRNNRILVDIRPVIDRDGAAREVLKYITKCAAFCDLAEAVEPFSKAVRGARLIQTFGSWYGVKLDEKPDPEKPRDWRKLKCTCGENIWKRMGIFYRRDVQMDSAGRWWLSRNLDWRSPGTVPRPTIRALEERQE